MESTGAEHDELDYVGGGLPKTTNWWGAFVIGLAGTILVTGIAPYVVQGTGGLGIILIGVMTIAGCFLCLCLAELGTMWPDRTGGIPGYATESFRPLVGDTVARVRQRVPGAPVLAKPVYPERLADAIVEASKGATSPLAA